MPHRLPEKRKYLQRKTSEIYGSCSEKPPRSLREAVSGPPRRLETGISKVFRIFVAEEARDILSRAKGRSTGGETL